MRRDFVDTVSQMLKIKRRDLIEKDLILLQLLLVHVRRGLHVAQRKALDAHQEQGLVAEIEPLLAAAHPSVRVSEAAAGVVGVPAAPRGQVGAVNARCLDEADGGEGLGPPQSQSHTPF